MFNLLPFLNAMGFLLRNTILSLGDFVSLEEDLSLTYSNSQSPGSGVLFIPFSIKAGSSVS